MSDKNLTSLSKSYTLNVDHPLKENEDLTEGVFLGKEVTGSFVNSKVPQSIEVLTTTDSRTSDFRGSPASALQPSTDNYEDGHTTDFVVVDTPEFTATKATKDLSVADTSYNENKGLNSSFSSNLSLKLFFFMLVFVLTNTAQPLLNGTYTFLLPTYLAMVLVGVYPTKKSIFEENWKYPIFLSFMDVLHQVIEKAGLIYCGPSIYSIASSTNTMFLALFSKLILKQTVTSLTWLSISLISFSLALSGYVQVEYITSLHILGFCLVVLASMVSALNSTIGEVLLKKNQIEGPNLVCMMGLTSLSVFGVWSIVWTVPQRHKLFATDKEVNPFDLNNVLSILLVLLVSNFGRSSVYYYIIKKCGSVSCGVLKALRIVLVVLGDHYLFSYIDGAQKLSLGKIVASLLCTTGVVFYSLERSDWSLVKKTD